MGVQFLVLQPESYFRDRILHHRETKNEVKYPFASWPTKFENIYHPRSAFKGTFYQCSLPVFSVGKHYEHLRGATESLYFCSDCSHPFLCNLVSLFILRSNVCSSSKWSMPNPAKCLHFVGQPPSPTRPFSEIFHHYGLCRVADHPSGEKVNRDFRRSALWMIIFMYRYTSTLLHELHGSQGHDNQVSQFFYFYLFFFFGG